MATTLTLKPGNTADQAPQTLESVLAQLDAMQTTATQQAEANKALGDELEASKAETAAAKLAPAVEPAKEPEAPSQYADLMGKRAWLVAVHGDMVNLHTGERLTSDPKKTSVDQFYLNQLDAGKVALHIEAAE